MAGYDVLKKYQIEISTDLKGLLKQLDALEDQVGKKLGNVGLADGMRDDISKLTEQINGLKGSLKSSVNEINTNIKAINTDDMKKEFALMTESVSGNINGLTKKIETLQDSMTFLEKGDFSGLEKNFGSTVSQLSSQMDTIIEKFSSFNKFTEDLRIGAIDVTGLSNATTALDNIGNAAEKSSKKTQAAVDEQTAAIRKSIKDFASVRNNISEIITDRDTEGYTKSEIEDMLAYADALKRQYAEIKKLNFKDLNVDSLFNDEDFNIETVKRFGNQLREVLEEIDYNTKKNMPKAIDTDVRFRIKLDEDSKGTATVQSIVNKVNDVVSKAQEQVDTIYVKMGIQADTSNLGLTTEEQEKIDKATTESDKMVRAIKMKAKIDVESLRKNVNDAIKDINTELKAPDAKKIEVQVVGKLDKSSVEKTATDINEEIELQQYNNQNKSFINGGNINVNSDSIEGILFDIKSILSGWETTGIPAVQNSEAMVGKQQVQKDIYNYDELFKIRQRKNITLSDIENQAATTALLRASLEHNSTKQQELQTLKRSRKLKKGDKSVLQNSDYYNASFEYNGVEYAKYGDGSQTLEEWKAFLDNVKMFGETIKNADGTTTKVKGYLDNALNTVEKRIKSDRESLSLNSVEYAKDSSGHYTDRILYEKGTVTGTDDIYKVTENNINSVKKQASEELEIQHSKTEDLINQRRLMQELVELSNKRGSEELTYSEKERYKVIETELEQKSMQISDEEKYNKLIKERVDLENKELKERLNSKELSKLKELNTEIENSFVKSSLSMEEYSKEQLSLLDDGFSKIDARIIDSQKKENKIIADARKSMRNISQENVLSVNSDKQYQYNENEINKLNQQNNKLAKAISVSSNGKYDYSALTSSEKQIYFDNEKRIKYLKLQNKLYKEQQDIENGLLGTENERTKTTAKISGLGVSNKTNKEYAQMLIQKPQGLTDTEYVSKMADDELKKAYDVVKKVQSEIDTMEGMSDEEITAKAEKLIQGDIKLLKSELKAATETYKKHQADNAPSKVLKNDQYKVNSIQDSINLLETGDSNKLQEEKDKLNTIEKEEQNIIQTIMNKNNLNDETIEKLKTILDLNKRIKDNSFDLSQEYNRINTSKVTSNPTSANEVSPEQAEEMQLKVSNISQYIKSLQAEKEMILRDLEESSNLLNTYKDKINITKSKLSIVSQKIDSLTAEEKEALSHELKTPISNYIKDIQDEVENYSNKLGGSPDLLSQLELVSEHQKGQNKRNGTKTQSYADSKELLSLMELEIDKTEQLAKVEEIEQKQKDNLYEKRLNLYKQQISSNGETSKGTVGNYSKYITDEIEKRKQLKAISEQQAKADKKLQEQSQRAQNVSEKTQIKKVNQKYNGYIAQYEDNIASYQEELGVSASEFETIKKKQNSVKKSMSRYNGLNAYQEEIDSITELQKFREENIQQVQKSIEEDDQHKQVLESKLKDNPQLQSIYDGTIKRIQENQSLLIELQNKNSEDLLEENKQIQDIINKRNHYMNKYGSKNKSSMSTSELSDIQNNSITTANNSLVQYQELSKQYKNGNYTDAEKQVLQSQIKSFQKEFVENAFNYLSYGGDYSKLPKEFATILRNYINESIDGVSELVNQAQFKVSTIKTKLSTEQAQLSDTKQAKQDEINQIKLNQASKEYNALLKEQFALAKNSNISRGMNPDQQFASFKVDTELKNISNLEKDLNKQEVGSDQYIELQKQIANAKERLIEYKTEAKSLDLSVSNTTGRMYLDDAVKDKKIKGVSYTGLGEIKNSNVASIEEQTNKHKAQLGILESEKNAEKETNNERSRGSKYLEGMNADQIKAAKELQKVNREWATQQKLIEKNSSSSKRKNEEEIAQLKEQLGLKQEACKAVGLDINDSGYATLPPSSPEVDNEPSSTVDVSQIKSTSGLALESTLQEIKALLAGNINVNITGSNNNITGNNNSITGEGVNSSAKGNNSSAKSKIVSDNQAAQEAIEETTEKVVESEKEKKQITQSNIDALNKQLVKANAILKRTDLSDSARDKWTGIKNSTLETGNILGLSLGADGKFESISAGVEETSTATSELNENLKMTETEIKTIKNMASELSDAFKGVVDIQKKVDKDGNLKYKVSNTKGDSATFDMKNDGTTTQSYNLSKQATELKNVMRQIQSLTQNQNVLKIQNMMPELASESDIKNIKDAQVGFEKLLNILEEYNNGKTDFSNNEISDLQNLVNTVRATATTLPGIMKVGDSVNLGRINVQDINNLRTKLTSLAKESSNTAIQIKKFGVANKDVTYTLRTSSNMLETYRISIDETGTAIKTLVSSEKYLTGFQKAIGGMREKFGEILRYTVASVSIYEVFNFFKQGVSNVKDFDDALTELYKVSNDTADSLARFSKESFNIANQIGSTGKEIVNSASDWEKLGYSISEASELAKNSALYSNVGDIEIDTATEHMVSTLKAFNMEASDSIKIVDEFNDIGNNYAITSEGIGSALERSASSLVAAGNDLEQSIALITAGNIVTQDAESVGNAIKVLSLRIRGASSDLEDMGEDTDGLASSTSKLREQIKGLTGVDIMLDENNFKSTYEIMLEISKVWDKLTDVSQAAVLEKLAGKTRASVVAGLLQQGETLEKVYSDANNASGSAMAENEKYMDSIQGHIDIITNKWQQLWNSDITRDQVNMFIDLGSAALDFANNLGLVKTAALALGAVFAIKKSGGRAKRRNTCFYSSICCNKKVNYPSQFS